jgi:hypothetical protein
MKAPTEVSNVTALRKRLTHREKAALHTKKAERRGETRDLETRDAVTTERERSRDREKRKFLVWRWQVERMRMQGVRVCRRPM